MAAPMSPQNLKYDKAAAAAGVLPIRGAWIPPPDHRDALIEWLRGEFAAANAIIDGLCQHLHHTGSPGEYDFVIGSIQSRRFGWSGVLHMQQYFSVSDVLLALHHVAMKRQYENAGHHSHGVSPSHSGGRREFYPNPSSRRNNPKNGRMVKPAESSATSSASDQQVESSGGDSVDQSLPVSQNGEPQFVNDKEDSLVELGLGRLKAEEEVASADHVVERCQKVAGGELYHHVFDEHLAAEVLGRISSVEQSCLRGKLQTGDFDEKNSQVKTPRSAPGFLQSMVQQLSKAGVLSNDVRPNSFIVNVIEEDKSLSFEEQKLWFQPLYFVSLLSDCSLVVGQGSTLSLPAGSLLKVEARNRTGYRVNSAPAKRVLVAFGMEQQQQQQSDHRKRSTEAKCSKKHETSLPGTGSASSTSTLSSWQARPGTGVYIPGPGGSSNSSKCDIVMNSYMQDVR